MKYLVAAVLIAHAIAHGPGVVMPFVASPESSSTTMLLGGRWDVGTNGLRFLAACWLIVAVGLIVAAVGLIRGASWSISWIAACILGSLVLSVLNWPLAKIGVIVNIVVLLGLPFIGSVAWEATSAATTRQLHLVKGRSLPARQHPVLDSLPPPVARYLARATANQRVEVDAVSLRQAGEFRVGDRWYPFRATQRFTVEPVGFIWDARIAMSPVMPVLVRDSYVSGVASMRAGVLGVWTMANQSNRAELDAGSLQRYLAEAVWFPAALVPRPNLRWEPIDDRSARATLTDGRTSVSLEFRFTEDGDVREMFAPDRFAEEGGRYERRPWIVRCFEYELHAGMRVPARCEVAWQTTDGTDQPYWRGRITDLQYQPPAVLYVPASAQAAMRPAP